MTMPWLPSLNTGEHGFDEDHRYIFEVLEALRASLGAGNDSGVRALFTELYAISEAHFREEEALMDRHGYEGALAHRAGHDRGRVILARMDGDLAGGRIGRFTEALADFTAGYFHGVLRHDLMLARFLRQRSGVTLAPCAPLAVPSSAAF